MDDKSVHSRVPSEVKSISLFVTTMLL